MKPILDISLPLNADLPIWPGSTGWSIRRTMEIAGGDPANVSRLCCDVHVGTHVDAPIHFMENGEGVDKIPLGHLVGPARVVELGNATEIGPKELNSLSITRGTQRLLFRTWNSVLWSASDATFREDFVGLTPEGARWIVDRGIDLVGIDYLSIQRFGDEFITHKVLLGAGVVIVEGLNLAHVQPGQYEFICLPINLIAADGAPARAILRPLSE